MAMKLYNYFRSSASYRVRIALALKGLDYDYIPVHLQRNEQFAESYAALSPARLVPLLEDGDNLVSQSLAIIEYLEETHPEPPLLPKDAAARARVRALALDIACEIHPLNNLRVLRYLVKDLKVGEDDKNRWYRHWVETGLEVVERRLAAAPPIRGGSFSRVSAINWAVTFVRTTMNPTRFPADDAQDSTELLPTRASLLERLRQWSDNASWQEFFDTYWKLIYVTARAAGDAEQGAHPDHARGSQPEGKPAGDQGTDDVACDDNAEAGSKPLRREPVKIDEHKGRAGDEGKQRRVSERDAEQEAEVAARGQQGTEILQNAAKLRRRRIGMGIALAQHGEDGECLHGREQGQGGEIGAPAVPHGKPAPDERSDHGGDGHGAADVGQHPRRLHRPIHVADDGPAQHRPGAGAECLEETGGDQGLDAGGGHAGQRRGQVQQQAEQHRRPAAVAVGQRAVKKLGHREADQEHRQCQLHAGDIGGEFGGHAGQRRQVQVGRQGPQRHQRRQQQGQAERGGKHPLDFNSPGAQAVWRSRTRRLASILCRISSGSPK